jgi:hypothetical protein
VLRERRLIKYGNKGNMTKEEIDFTCNADRAEEAGAVPRHLDHLRPIGAADGRGEV